MRTALLLLILLALAAAGIHVAAPDMLSRYLPSVHNATPAMQAAPPLSPPSPWVCGVGRVEPASEEIDLAFEYGGLVADVLVREADPVRQGQVVALLKSDEHKARLDTALAEQEAMQAEYDKVVAGARQEEKSESWLAVQRMRTLMDNARTEMMRRQTLLHQQIIAPEELDRAVTEYKVAQREHEEAMQRHLVTLNLSRREDILVAHARLQAARNRVAEAQAALLSTQLRSPLDGTVLRRYRHPGENVSVFFPSPVLRVGDISTLNIRTEVDEADFNTVLPGQQAYFTCDAFGDQKFTGTVLRVTPMMGTKRLLTESATERVDAKVIEVLIAAESPTGLVTGLIVDVFIDTSPQPSGVFKSKVSATSARQE